VTQVSDPTQGLFPGLNKENEWICCCDEACITVRLAVDKGSWLGSPEALTMTTRIEHSEQPKQYIATKKIGSGDMHKQRVSPITAAFATKCKD